MRSGHAIGWSARLLALFVLGAILTGCGTVPNGGISFGSRIGFRPDDPKFTVPSPTEQCSALTEYIVYAVDLKESYRVRATQNRTWLYVAGIVGLGVAAASGGLGIAGAAAGTIALLSVSGGFTAGAFATINNSELANVYTVAANDINSALAYVEARMTRCHSQEDCSGQLAYLREAVTTARNTLETARTDSAAGALARATAQKKLLDDEIAKVKEQIAAPPKTKAEKAADEKAVAEMKAAATKAQVEANTTKDQADTAQKKAEQASDGTAKTKAEEDAKKAKDKADEAQKIATDKAEAAAKAEAKLAADSAARLAAMAPVTPECLADNSAIVVQAAIKDVTPTTVMAANTTIKLTITPIRLGSFPPNDLKVSVGAQEVSVTAITNASGDTWEVAFIAPPPSPTPPGLAAGSYDVSLLVGQNKQRVENNSGKKLQY
jgi:hypothetical protein